MGAEIDNWSLHAVRSWPSGWLMSFHFTNCWDSKLNLSGCWCLYSVCLGASNQSFSFRAQYLQTIRGGEAALTVVVKLCKGLNPLLRKKGCGCKDWHHTLATLDSKSLMGFVQVHIQCVREQGRGKHNIQVWFPDRESDSSRQDGLRSWRDPKQNKNVEPFVRKARKKMPFPFSPSLSLSTCHGV